MSTVDFGVGRGTAPVCRTNGQGGGS